MTAEYLFFLAFTIQILVLSAIFPQVLLRRARLQMQAYPRERYPQLYPYSEATIEIWMRWYRGLNWVIVLAGLLVLAGLYRYMRQAGWDDGPVETAAAVYFFVQIIPLLFTSVGLVHFNKALWENYAGDRHTAVFERRRLFDFISPVVVILTAALYPVFILLVIYIQQNPFPGFAGYINILFITLLYLLLFGVAWITIHGKKENPYLSHSARLQRIGIQVKLAIYSCLAGVIFLGLNLLLAFNDAQSYEPFAESLFFLSYSVLLFVGLSNTPVALKLDVARTAS